MSEVNSTLQERRGAGTGCPWSSGCPTPGDYNARTSRQPVAPTWSSPAPPRSSRTRARRRCAHCGSRSTAARPAAAGTHTHGAVTAPRRAGCGRNEEPRRPAPEARKGRGRVQGGESGTAPSSPGWRAAGSAARSSTAASPSWRNATTSTARARPAARAL